MPVEKSKCIKKYQKDRSQRHRMVSQKMNVVMSNDVLNTAVQALGINVKLESAENTLQARSFNASNGRCSHQFRPRSSSK
ncbi:hypothetical protein Tco_1560881 [Tanacetum coccineum]|uniref:Uncharacterized protein n=1 Tax=Tanacetum coccineum TaxID=301880 RepID=A0ABQ5GSR8_9ASTR